MKKLPGEVRHAVREIAKVDFEDASEVAAYLASPSPWGQTAFDNCQVQFLTDTRRPPDYLPRKPVTEAQIENAAARLEVFDFLAVTEDISHCVAQIAAAYRRRPSAPPTLNVGNHGRRVNWRDPAIREAMSPLLHGEVAVYRRATELVEQRRADAIDSAASRRGLHVKPSIDVQPSRKAA
jgi:hypothetical protein